MPTCHQNYQGKTSMKAKVNQLPEVVYPTYPFFNVRILRWYRMDIVSTILHLSSTGNMYIRIVHLWHIFMSYIS